MIGISEVKEIVKQKLIDDAIELNVEFAPDNPSEFRVTHPKGTILIAYGGTSYSEPMITKQSAISTINIILCLRTGFNGEKGVECVDLVRKSLTSNFLICGHRMWCSNIAVDGEDNGIWYYTLTFILPYAIYQGE